MAEPALIAGRRRISSRGARSAGFLTVLLALGTACLPLRPAPPPPSPDAVLRAVVKSGRLPGVVALAASRNGILHQGACGSLAMGSDRPMQVDTLFYIASMTKPITSLAILQLVEQGRVNLDASVADYLPELAHPRVLEGFDAAGRLIWRTATRPPTIRELLTHTSGYAYGMFNENLRRFDPTVSRQRRDDFIRLPLASDPGTRWEYGPGPAFLGLVVEKVSGLTLEAYFQRHIFGPLRMHDTFYQVPADQWARVVSRHNRRAGDGAVIPQPKDPAPPHLTFFPGDGTLHSTGPDYLRFIRAFLNGGELDGARIAKPETIEMMCRNQIGDFRAGEMPSAMPALSNPVHLFPGATNQFGFGFLINARPVPGGRSAGSVMWGGLHNTYFWIDREQGIGGVVLTQLLPFADPVTLDLVTDYERAIYALPR